MYKETEQGTVGYTCFIYIFKTMLRTQNHKAPQKRFLIGLMWNNLQKITVYLNEVTYFENKNIKVTSLWGKSATCLVQ